MIDYLVRQEEVKKSYRIRLIQEDWIVTFYEEGEEVGVSYYSSEEEAIVAACHFMTGRIFE